MHYELQNVDHEGVVRQAVATPSIPELGRLIGEAIAWVQVVRIDDDGETQALTPVENAALAAAIEQEASVGRPLSDGSGWLVLPGFPGEEDDD